MTAVGVIAIAPSRIDPTLSPSISCLDLLLTKYGYPTTQGRETVSTLNVYGARLTINPSLYLDRAALHFNEDHATDLSQHIEITFQDDQNRECTLRLFIENQEKEVETKDNQTWTPTQRAYVP